MFTWYYIFNTDEFDALDIPSQSLTLILGDIGSQEVTIFKGNFYGIKFDDVLLCVNVNDRNPFQFEGYAIYLDDENNIWLGIEIED